MNHREGETPTAPGTPAGPHRDFASSAPTPHRRAQPRSQGDSQPSGARSVPPLGGYLGLSGRISAVAAAILEAPSPASACQLPPAQPMTAGLRKAGRPKPRRLRLRLWTLERIPCWVFQGRGTLLIVFRRCPCSASSLFAYELMYIYLFAYYPCTADP